MQQGAEGGDKAGHVGEGGGVEGLVYTAHFIAVENTELDQLLFGAAAGVIFDRQRDELEEADNRQRNRADGEQVVTERASS